LFEEINKVNQFTDNSGAAEANGFEDAENADSLF
jgi:hypothetical protein